MSTTEPGFEHPVIKGERHCGTCDVNGKHPNRSDVCLCCFCVLVRNKDKEPGKKTNAG